MVLSSIVRTVNLANLFASIHFEIIDLLLCWVEAEKDLAICRPLGFKAYKHIIVLLLYPWSESILGTLDIFLETDLLQVLEFGQRRTRVISLNFINIEDDLVLT